MNIQKIAKWFGIVVLALGVLGFVPGIVSTGGLLFGVFLVSILINLIHIIAGLVGIESAMTATAAKRYFKIVGVIFAVLSILGFFFNGRVLTANVAGSVLAAVAAIVALYFGFRQEGVVVAAPTM
jgi:hypothetical protein